MKKDLITKGRQYKANLHCHSTISDGKMTPEQIKDRYKSEGYSVVAYTDHDIMIPHLELCDDEFIALTGYEVEINQTSQDTDSLYKKVCHMCFVAKTPDIKNQVCWHREKYLFGNAPQYQDKACFNESLPDFERIYTPECINEMIKRAKEGGYFVTYNHPTWSLEEYPDYMAYEGMDAMEIVNYACIVSGYPEYNARVFDDMLRGGKKVYCVAADDNHSMANSCGGFVMISADALEYCKITKALEEGKFYASEGPIIDELWYEDGKLHIKCSPVRQICFCCGKRRTRSQSANGELLTEAVFELPPEYGYVRVSLIDESGKHADTQAYYQQDLQD